MSAPGAARVGGSEETDAAEPALPSDALASIEALNGLAAPKKAFSREL